jgi:hypothetical protein
MWRDKPLLAKRHERARRLWAGLPPGAGNLFVSARVEAIACTDCGLIRCFAPRDAIRKIAGGDKWKRVP